MKVLLDTQAFLWFAIGDEQLSGKAKKIFLDDENELYLSLASVWEMAIKISTGKLKLKISLEKFILNQLQVNAIKQLPIDFRHILQVSHLPFHHRDPFDRLIIGQSIEEKMSIVSSDKAFDLYKVKRAW